MKANLAIPTEIEEVDKEKYKFINERINELENKKQTVLNGGAAAEKETELIKLRNQKLLVQNEVPDVKALKDEEYSLNIQIDSLEHKKERAENEIQVKKSMQDANKSRRDPLRKERNELEAKYYDSSKNICPECGQMRTQEQIKKLRRRI